MDILVDLLLCQRGWLILRGILRPYRINKLGLIRRRFNLNVIRVSLSLDILAAAVLNFRYAERRSIEVVRLTIR